MFGVSIAQPDITLSLDTDGVINDATLSNSIATERVEGWIGRPWFETVGDVGGEKVRRMLEDARTSGISAFGQVTQRFPSGLELPVEYTTVRLAGKSGLVAVGKNLQAFAELQSRLIATQQAREQEYWKLREVETRYRLLFDASSEAVLLVRAENLRIAELNIAAIRLLGLAPDRELITVIAPDERDAFQGMLARVRDQGRAPGILLHLGTDRTVWTVRASLLTSEPGSVFLLQLAPISSAPSAASLTDAISIDDLLDRLPDGFVVLDQDGIIRRANRGFLDLVQVGSEASVVGERLGRWLARPGTDLSVLLANVQRHGAVRLFATTIQGALGTDTEVEISAAGDADAKPRYFGILIRDVARRLAPSDDRQRALSALGPIPDQIGKTSLLDVVKDTVGVVERHYIKTALALASGNRTAAAELLGLSRQSLHAKLNRYGFEGLLPAEGRAD